MAPPLPAPPPPSGLYVHVPFCLARCPYCDFASRAGATPSQVEQYLEALERELAGLDPAGLRTVYVGGGTPTSLEGAQLDRLLRLLAPFLVRAEEASVEANPAAATGETFRRLAGAGFSRVSIGAQSFDPGLLRTLGRIHDAAAIPATVEAARAAGLVSVGLDLIFGVPGQTLSLLRQDLARALALEPDHVSAYGLTWEEGTPLARARETGELQPVSPEEERDLLLEVRGTLLAAGLEHHEISSYARTGHRCRHNENYWAYGRWVAAGPSAARFVGWRRTTNTPDLERWARAPGEVHDLDEVIDPEAARREVLLLGLRRLEGLSREEYRLRCGGDLDRERGARMEELSAQGLLADDGSRIRLTEAGLLVADRVLLALF